MPSLPPGYLPVCILPLYVIARALHEGLPAEGAPTFDLKAIGGHRPALFTTTNEGKRRSYGLVSRSITPSAIGVELSLQPRALERPAPRPGRVLPPLPLPVPNGAVAARPEPAPEPPPPVPFTVTLVPPYRDCLQSEQLAATTRLGGLAGLPRTAHSPRPTFEAPSFGFPEIAAKLGEAVANALYNGAVRTTLHEVTGDLTPIPQRFWRTDDGEAVLADHSETVVPLMSDRQARGWAIVDEAALDAVWRSVTGRRLAAPAQGAGTAGPQPSPWEALIRELAFNLEYSGGLPLKNKSLSIDDVLVLVREKWDEKVFGPYRKGLARALATFVLHPDILKGGKPTQAEIRERTRLRVARKRKEAREKAKVAKDLPE